MVRVTARRRQGWTHDVEIEGDHRLVIDEPEASGGADEGPSPTRTVAAALAACAAITIEMYADRKGWDVRDVRADVDMEYGDPHVPRSFDVTLHVTGDLSAEQVERLRVIAAKCPIHRMLAHDPDVTITDRVRLAGSGTR
jgi:putative redox protein